MSNRILTEYCAKCKEKNPEEMYCHTYYTESGDPRKSERTVFKWYCEKCFPEIETKDREKNP